MKTVSHMNAAVLLAIRLTSMPVGFVAAVSFLRNQNRAFDWYYSRMLLGGFNLGLGFNSALDFNFGTGPSAVLFLFALVAFTFSIALRQGAPSYPLRRVDYMYLFVVCGAGFAICTRMLLVAGFPGGVWQNPMFVFIFMVPLAAYCFALLAYGELVARLRDGTFVKTLYWIGFFRVYSIWKPIGLLAFLLMSLQIILIIFFIGVSLVVLVALFVMGALTYYAVHMISLAAEYDIAAADKIRAERFKSELITNVSHDIKTPLTSIINYVDLLNAENLEGQAAEYVDVLTRKSARLKLLIDDLMEASKAGTGNLRVDMQEINLSEMVGQVAGEFEDGFVDKGLTLVIRQPGGEGSNEITNDVTPSINVVADSRHLYRALENLFANAAKYGLGGTRVFAEIVSLPGEGKALFSLQNTSALPIETSGRELTEQFIRGDKARNTEGSGLGLYIAKSLVELMGGGLTIHVIGDLFRVEVVL